MLASFSKIKIQLFTLLCITLLCTTGCKSHRNWGLAAEIEAMPDDSIERKFNTIYLESVCKMAEGDHDAQYALLMKAQEIKPDAPEVLLDLVALYSEFPALLPDSAQLKVNEDMLKKVLAQLPKNKEARKELISLYGQHAMFKEAIAHCDTLLAEKYDDDILRYKHLVHRSFSEDTAAWESFEIIAKHNGESDATLEERFQILSSASDSAFAVEKAKAFVAQHPNDNAAKILLARVCIAKNNYSEAKSILHDVLSNDPKNIEGLTNEVVLILLEKNNSSKDVEKINQYLNNPEGFSIIKAHIIHRYPAIQTKNPEDIPFCKKRMFDMAFSTKQTGTDVLDLYLEAPPEIDTLYTDIYIREKILEIDPSRSKDRLILLQHYIDENDVEGLEKLCAEGVRYYNDRTLYAYYGALAYLTREENDKAIEILEQGIDEDEDHLDKKLFSESYQLLASLKNDKGEIKEARTYYEKSLEYNPYNILSANNYAYLIACYGGDLNKAEEYILMAVDAEPTTAYIWDTYATILLKKGDFEKAKNTINTAIKLMNESEEEDATYYLHAGDIYFKLNKKNTALNFWRKALKLEKDSDERTKIKQRINTRSIPE